MEPAAPARGREKPWRLTSRRLSISGEGLDPEAALAAETVDEIHLDHEFGRMKEAIAAVHRREMERAAARSGLTA